MPTQPINFALALLMAQAASVLGMRKPKNSFYTLQNDKSDHSTTWETPPDGFFANLLHKVSLRSILSTYNALQMKVIKLASIPPQYPLKYKML